MSELSVTRFIAEPSYLSYTFADVFNYVNLNDLPFVFTLSAENRYRTAALFKYATIEYNLTHPYPVQLNFIRQDHTLFGIVSPV